MGYIYVICIMYTTYSFYPLVFISYEKSFIFFHNWDTSVGTHLYLRFCVSLGEGSTNVGSNGNQTGQTLQRSQGNVLVIDFKLENFIKWVL